MRSERDNHDFGFRLRAGTPSHSRPSVTHFSRRDHIAEAPANHPGLKPFTTDGCSGFMSFAWRIVLRKKPPWEGCCLIHDRAYWRGGDKKWRKLVDIELMRCVAAKGHPYWAIIMFIAVRAGGPWWLPFPSIRFTRDGCHFSLFEVRWGYGWRYPRYKE